MSISKADIERNLSIPRLDKYRLPAADDTEAVCLYLWNMELSQALQPALHAIEVNLRNSIHAAAIAHFRTHEWFRDPAILALQDREKRMLNQAVDQLWQAAGHNPWRIRQALDPTPPLPSTDKHIAALTLGFWVALFNRPYRRELWSDLPHASPPRRNLLPDVFPFATTAQHQQIPLHQKLIRIRDFRNRVSHHEPIWNWPHTPDGQYREIVEVISWISPGTLSLLGIVDQFLAIHGRRHHHYRASLTLVS